MVDNLALIQQLMAAGKLDGVTAPTTGSMGAPVAPLLPPPIEQPPAPMMEQPEVAPDMMMPEVQPAGQPPVQMPFEAPMQPQQQHVQSDPVKGIGEAQKGLDAAFNRQEKAVQKAANLGQQKAAEETAFNIEQDKRMTEFGNRQAEAETERQTRTQDGMTRLSQIQGEYADMKIDPNRFWESRSTTGKILTAIGLIFGSAGGGNTNQAVTILQNSITQDLELQKLSIDQKGNEVNQQKGLLNEMRQQFGDARSAEAATKTLMVEEAQRQVQIIGGKYRGEEASAALEQVMGQLEADKQKAIGDFYKATDDMNYRRSLLQLEREKMSLDFMMKMGATDNKSTVTVREGMNPDGTIRYGQRQARDPEAAKKAREAYGVTEELVALIDEAKAFRANNGRAWQPRLSGIVGGGAEASDAQRITTQITLKVKSLEAMGALDAGVLKVGEMIAKNPGSIFTSDEALQKTYSNFRAAIIRQSNAHLRQYGPDIVFTDPVANRTDDLTFVSDSTKGKDTTTVKK